MYAGHYALPKISILYWWLWNPIHWCLLFCALSKIYKVMIVHWVCMDGLFSTFFSRSDTLVNDYDHDKFTLVCRALCPSKNFYTIRWLWNPIHWCLLFCALSKIYKVMIVHWVCMGGLFSTFFSRSDFLIDSCSFPYFTCPTSWPRS